MIKSIRFPSNNPNREYVIYTSPENIKAWEEAWKKEFERLFLMKDLKTAAAHKVEFKFDSDDKSWYIVHKANGGYEYCLSENNTWTRESDKIRKFNFLHIAVNYAKRKGFNYHPVPEFSFFISNDTLNITENGDTVEVIPNIHSAKQASDIIKEKYAVNISRMD